MIIHLEKFIITKKIYLRKYQKINLFLGPGTSAPSSITDDYVHCNMCNRKYNENAYSKHLPTCERRTKEAQFKKGGLVNTQTNMNMQGANRNINNNNNNYGNQIGGNRMGGNMMNNNTNAKYGRK